MWTLVILSALVAEPGSAVPDIHLDGPLDSWRIAAIAADTSPSVRGALARVAGKGAELRELDQRFWPRVTTTARYTRLSRSDPTVIAPPDLPIVVEIPGAVPNQLAIGIGVALPLSDWLLRWDEAKVAGRHAEAAERALVEVARNKAAAEALGLWYEWQRARLGVAVTSAGLTDAEAHLAAANTLMKAEVASIADVRLAEARVAAARLAVDRARHGEALTASALATLLHRNKEGTDLAGSTDPLWPIPAGGRDALVARGLAQRPEARAIAEGEAALAARRDVVVADRWPRLDVVANAQVVNPNPRGLQNEDELVAIWDASAVLTWRLNGLWESDVAAQQIAAEQVRLSADRDALADGIALEVDLALRMVADADAAARASEAMLVAAEEAHRVRTKAYAAGKASSLDLSEAERQLTEARLGVVDATIDRRVGELRLAHALGEPLTERRP